MKKKEEAVSGQQSAVSHEERRPGVQFVAGSRLLLDLLEVAVRMAEERKHPRLEEIRAALREVERRPITEE